MSTFDRRAALKAIGAGVLLAGCRRGSTLSVACERIPAETAGPFPGDGSNGPNVLADPAVVRSDIRRSTGAFHGTAPGVPLHVRLRVEDRKDCLPIAGAAVYLWHCGRDGRYSMYEVEDQNYLRGVQATDRNGDAVFVTVFPGAYAGRWPHLHLEVYDTLAAARASGKVRRTTQLALPEAACREVYASAGYERSLAELGRTSLDGDAVFADGHDQQVPTVVGSLRNGYTLVQTLAV